MKTIVIGKLRDGNTETYEMMLHISHVRRHYQVRGNFGTKENKDLNVKK